KIVREAAHFARALDAARSEAKAAFKNDAVYVERFVERPRHIEIQVAADHHGNVVHLGERECSVQRRYQKIIEEAPSPALTPERRAEIGGRVVTALKALGYQSLGTVELLMDEAGGLHFMEMNTRVQVEHPVTEMLVRRDLVRLQIMIARGEPLPFTQDDVHFEGHAIECRINAEDPVRFAPSPGTISAFHVPGGPGLRVDTHVTAGAVIPPNYDSLIAKVVVHDIDREHAIRRMQSALRELVVEGVQTNQSFHRRVLAHEEFRAGRYDTTLVPRIQCEA
ncbi:MAG: acetyl-CoA carboxylase biotin carboxylase subunit, partial [Myxococcales bacterium]|nr:acetyl-CoA carboxylase biotin carboxylase subunit [Myxococcales bacterium]